MDSPLKFVQQDIFKAPFPAIPLKSCHESDIQAFLPSFLESVEHGTIGLAPVYGTKCCLKSLAVSSLSTILFINMSSKEKTSENNKKRVASSRESLQSFLCDATISKYAFQMDKLAAALSMDFGIHIRGGRDLLSSSKASRESLEAVMGALGGETTLHKRAVTKLFCNQETASNDSKTTALQAWAACQAATHPHMRPKVERILPVNTADMEASTLKLIAKTIRDLSRLVALKPIRVKNEIDQKFVHKDGKLMVTSERYKTRVMPTAGHQVVEIKTREANGSQRIIQARVPAISGRVATVSVSGRIGNAKIQSMETIGREQPTSAETFRTHVMLHALQNSICLSAHPFIRAIWFPKKRPFWNESPKISTPPSMHFPSERTLNVSQAKAVNTILSNDDNDRVVLIHGPPGTGKTTVIAATVTSVMSSADRDRTVWLVAQSNVAVKNIAEKLASVDFVDFKILVSKDFHFDWHEHLYTKINPNLIRSDDFVQDLVHTERQLLGSRVILCTLSMLSNENLDSFSRLVPLQTVIFDEASQIEIGDYFPMLIRYRPTLRKLVFIGDNKQLAPYGSSDVSDLDSIFEKPHLCKRAIFLDTQYRMPTPIGSFISQHVYNGQLKSHHAITNPASCRFVDVSNGFEEAKGHSWRNTREVDVAIRIAGQLISHGKSFRIITPYDPQRSLLENALKQAKLPWEDKCFNIDAFQGNEEDYIIVSLVRSKKMGFLKEMRRVNVMLTRCKKGMIICTNRGFIEDQAKKSLVGKLARSLGDGTWVGAHQVLHGSIQPFL